MIVDYIRMGKDYLAVDEFKAVCGRIIVLDGKIFVRESKTIHRPSTEARIAYLTEKHHEEDLKRSEQRRIAAAKDPKIEKQIQEYARNKRERVTANGR